MQRSTKVVVSLTAIPPRFQDLGRTLQSLLLQSYRPDAIEVTIPRNYRRFPEHSFCLPDVPEGVDITVEEDDLGPASKVLPCASRYRGQDVRIVYCDDDRVAPREWLSQMIAASRSNPGSAIVSAGTDLDRLVDLPAPTWDRLPRAARRRSRHDLQYRVRRLQQTARGWMQGEKLPKPGRNPFKKSGYVDVAEGLGGVSIAPNFFDELCYEIPRIVWAVDDIWLSGSLERQGIGIWADHRIKVPTEHRGGDVSPLAHSVVEGTRRHEANLACVKYMQESFGIWL